MLSGSGPTVIGYWAYPEDCTSVLCVDCADEFADCDEETGAAICDDHDGADRFVCSGCGRELIAAAAEWLA